MAKRNLYLNNTPVDEALAIYMKALEGDVKPVREEIRAEESLNRVTAEAVYAKYCSPLSTRRPWTASRWFPSARKERRRRSR